MRHDEATINAIRSKLNEQAARIQAPETAVLSDFYAQLPDHRYIHVPTPNCGRHGR